MLILIDHANVDAIAQTLTYLPIDGLTPEPDYPSFTAWFSEVAEKFAAGAFSVEDGDAIWLDYDE